ncbi:MAG: hypothetical protein AB1750_11875 [Chloroflexota bacterium]
MNDLLVNALMFVMILGSLFLAVVSFVPRFPKMVAPTWSTQFFATVIVVIASKVVTLYAILHWFLTSAAGTNHAFFIWGYFLCMWFGIFVYFNFGSSERERANTVRLLESTPLAITVSFGILLYYSFCAAIGYGYWQEQPDKSIFLYIALISVVDFFFFAVLWLRYWLRRGQVTAQARAYPNG